MMEKHVTLQWADGTFFTIDSADLYDLIGQHGTPAVAHLETNNDHRAVNLAVEAVEQPPNRTH